MAPGVVDTDMQALVRTADERDFPEVERFRQIAAEGSFTSPGWVAGHLLAIAFGDVLPDDVTFRIPAEPVPSRER